MEQRVTIGNAAVLIRHSELLPKSLVGLRRLGAQVVGGEAQGEATLEIETRSSRDWDLDVSAQGDAHLFGRPAYAFEVHPLESRMRLVLAAPPEGSDLYWFQRDIFGILACMSGGLMLHGAAVNTGEGGAWLFCGGSGAGKSTLCRMLVSSGLHAISDEVNWLFHGEDGELRLVNQPYWFAGIGAPFLPVTGLYLLEQGERCSLRTPLPPSETFVRLLASHLSIDTKYDFMKSRAEALRLLVEKHTIEVLEFNRNVEELLDLLWKKHEHKDS